MLLKLKITGRAPLLMQSGRLANPLDDLSRELKAITSLRKKTDEDLEATLRVKFMGSLYWDQKLGPYIPGENLDRALFDAAKEIKLGKKFTQCAYIVESALRLQYDGPRDPEALYADPAFRDVRMVVISKSRVPMCRPIFNRWGIEATLSFNEDLIDERDVRNIVSFAGRQGLGTFRRRFGKFEAEAAA